MQGKANEKKPACIAFAAEPWDASGYCDCHPNLTTSRRTKDLGWKSRNNTKLKNGRYMSRKSSVLMVSRLDVSFDEMHSRNT